MIKVPRTIVPSFFTIANMFFGFLAILYAFNSTDFVRSSWLIILAAFMDSMDGRVARFTGTSSKFGVEYDSLADVVSFGLAPSVLIYLYYFHNWGTVGVFISFFPLLFASIRLARFNVELEGFEKKAFTGLPSPASAIAIASYFIFMAAYLPNHLFPKYLLVLVLTVCVLMVSTIRYEVMPKLTFKGDLWQKIGFLIVILIVILLIINPQLFIFPLILLYILSGLIRFVIRLGQGKRLGGRGI